MTTIRSGIRGPALSGRQAGKLMAAVAAGCAIVHIAMALNCWSFNPSIALAMVAMTSMCLPCVWGLSTKTPTFRAWVMVVAFALAMLVLHLSSQHLASSSTDSVMVHSYNATTLESPITTMEMSSTTRLLEHTATTLAVVQAVLGSVFVFAAYCTQRRRNSST